MTDIDSNKVIEKLTEVLELLKAKKTEVETPKKEECAAKCDDENCEAKCPFRKIMSPQDFNDFCKMAKEMKKEDINKMCSKGACNGCPFMIKKVTYDNFEEIDEPVGVSKHEQSSKECFQVFNTILTLVLFVLFLVFLVRALKGFYCGV